MPKAVKAAAAGQGNVRRNTYAGKCAKCGSWSGRAVWHHVATPMAAEGFDPVHLDGECITGGTPVAAAITEGVYEKDGMVYRVTLSKGGNLYAQRAIVTPGQKLAWEVPRGAKGLTLVAGAAHHR